MGKLLKICKFIIGIIIVELPLVCYSQVDVEKATREVDRPMRKELEEKLRTLPQKIPEVKKEEEKVVEGPKFFVKKIKLVGCESFSPEEFKPVIEKYENREVSLAELKILAKEIEAEYLKRGVIAACFVPPQDVKEGVVILRVVEAKMGKLEIQDHKYFRKDRITYYWKVPPGEILHYDKLSRSLQFINKNPDREAKATLRAGKKPQTTDVLLDVETHFPVHLISSFDKEGTVFTGKERIGWGIRDNNFLGLDDTLLCGYTFGSDFSGIYAYHTVPVSSFGTSLLYGYSYSKSFPKKEYEPYGIDSRAKNTSFFVYQDIFKKDKYLGEVHLGLDIKDKTTKTNSGTFNRDRLRILRLGSNFTYKGSGSITYIKPEVSQGLNLFGARRKNPFSSRGAKNTFSKFNLDIQYKRILPLNLQISLKFRSQVSSTKLAPQEEFSLGGIDSVRGYPSGDYLADDAVQTNLELLIPAFFIPEKVKIPYAGRSLKEDVTALIFFDAGWGRRRFPNQTEKKSHNLRSVGAGLRIRLFDQVLLRLEWGFPIGDKPIVEEGKSCFHFSLDFEDRLPQEIERIKKLREEEKIKKFAWGILNREIKRPGSPLRKKLYSYLHRAKVAYKEGNLKEAKDYYEKIIEVAQFLYKQAENYIRACLKHQKELEKDNKLAWRYYKEGSFQKAKELWQKVIEEAKVKPLILEF